MGKFSKEMKEKYKDKNKKSIAVYLLLRLLVIVCMWIQIVMKQYNNALLCVLALFLFTIPTIISEKFKIGIPSLLESIIYMFIFSSAILGEINNFYGIIPGWDTMLHTLNGFICAGIGFSLVDLLNQNSERISLSPIYVALVGFCFSMTIGVLWEFYEFASDRVFLTDMQKDRVVQKFGSVDLNKEKVNSTVRVENIDKTTIHTKDDRIYVIEGGYLDIGIIDTMKDLFVNFIGAVVYSTLGYFYIKKRDYSFVKNFMPNKIKNENDYNTFKVHTK